MLTVYLRALRKMFHLQGSPVGSAVGGYRLWHSAGWRQEGQCFVWPTYPLLANLKDEPSSTVDRTLIPWDLDQTISLNLQ